MHAWSEAVHVHPLPNSIPSRCKHLLSFAGSILCATFECFSRAELLEFCKSRKGKPLLDRRAMTAEQPERLDGVDGLCHSIANSEMTQLPQIRTGPERRGVPGRRKVRPDPAERAHDAVPQPIAHTQRVSPTTNEALKAEPWQVCSEKCTNSYASPRKKKSLSSLANLLFGLEMNLARICLGSGTASSALTRLLYPATPDYDFVRSMEDSATANSYIGMPRDGAFPKHPSSNRQSD